MDCLKESPGELLKTRCLGLHTPQTSEIGVSNASMSFKVLWWFQGAIKVENPGPETESWGWEWGGDRGDSHTEETVEVK